MYKRLKLTDEEKKWNSYRGENGLPSVLLQKYDYEVTLTSAVQSTTIAHQTSRRSRVWKITWTGDTQAARVNIYTSVGVKFTQNPCHIPLLSGHSPHSTYARSALLATYPQTLTDAGGSLTSRHAAPAWELIWEPDIVLPGNVTLQFDYSLEDLTVTGDPILVAGGVYRIRHTVHTVEFPGFQGGAG